MKSPPATEHQRTTPVSSATKSAKAPKRANLLSLGFKPIAKPLANATVTAEEANVAKPMEALNTDATQSQQGKPRRINFMTGNIKCFSFIAVMNEFCRMLFVVC